MILQFYETCHPHGLMNTITLILFNLFNFCTSQTPFYLYVCIYIYTQYRKILEIDAFEYAILFKENIK